MSPRRALTRLTCIATVAYAALWQPAVAAEAESAPVSLAASAIVGGATDYVYRGATLHGGRPSGYLYGEVTYGPLYFNGLLVGTELGDDGLGRSIGNLEADATVGIAPSLGIVDFNFGVKYTGYPNGRDLITGTLTHAERDFIEGFAGAKIKIGDIATLGATGYYIPDFYYETGRVRTLELQGAVALPEFHKVQSRLTSTLGFVRSDAVDLVVPGNGYMYANVGVEGQLDRFVFDLRYWTSDVHNNENFGQRVVLMLGVKLP